MDRIRVQELTKQYLNAIDTGYIVDCILFEYWDQLPYAENEAQLAKIIHDSIIQAIARHALRYSDTITDITDIKYL